MTRAVPSQPRRFISTFLCLYARAGTRRESLDLFELVQFGLIGDIMNSAEVSVKSVLHVLVLNKVERRPLVGDTSRASSSLQVDESSASRAMTRLGCFCVPLPITR